MSMGHDEEMGASCTCLVLLWATFLLGSLLHFFLGGSSFAELLQKTAAVMLEGEEWAATILVPNCCFGSQLFISSAAWLSMENL